MYQTRLEYRDNPNAAWTLLDSWADVAAPSASVAILTTLKLEQDLGGLPTAELQELTAVVILSARLRGHRRQAFVGPPTRNRPRPSSDLIEYGHTQTRATDHVLSDRLSRAVREIYDADPDSGG